MSRLPSEMSKRPMASRKRAGPGRKPPAAAGRTKALPGENGTMEDGKPGADVHMRLSRLRADMFPALPARSGKSGVTGEVIARINAMIRDKELLPGDRLPAEISFARKLGVPRSAVSKVYTKLEAYGLIRTLPQSGTYLAGIDSDALATLMYNVMDTNIITVESDDIEFLYTFRAFLEEAAAAPLVRTATAAQLDALAEIQRWVRTKILDQNGTIEDDLLFHLKLAELSGRPIFKSILLFLAAPMVNVFRRMEEEGRTEEMAARWVRSMGEHDEIVAALYARDEERIRAAIRAHFKSSLDFRAKLLRHKESRGR